MKDAIESRLVCKALYITVKKQFPYGQIKLNFLLKGQFLLFLRT